MTVGANGLVDFLPVDTTPAYYWYGKVNPTQNQRMVGLRMGNKTIPTWNAVPGVLRNMTSANPNADAPPRHFLDKAADTWVQGVEMHYDREVADLTSGQITDESRLMRLQRRFQQLEDF